MSDDLSIKNILDLSDEVNARIVTIKDLLNKSFIMKLEEYNKLLELLKEHKNIKEASQQNDAKITELDKQINKLTEDIKNCEEKNGILLATNNDLNTEIGHLKAKLETLNKERDDLLKNIAELQRKLVECEKNKVNNSTTKIKFSRKKYRNRKTTTIISRQRKRKRKSIKRTKI